MNAHDSEKVVGTLVHSGYTQVDTPESAGLVVYNTCSIRDKAEQKVFHRLDQFKRAAGKGKVFAVIGCVAQQEGERILEKAPHVSLVAGSASYTKLPEMLVQLEAGNRRVTGLSLNSYRDPSSAGWDFATLLGRVGRIPGIRRVRFTTSHPRDFVKEIVDAIDGNPALCNHVHL